MSYYTAFYLPPVWIEYNRPEDFNNYDIARYAMERYYPKVLEWLTESAFHWTLTWNDYDVRDIYHPEYATAFRLEVIIEFTSHEEAALFKLFNTWF